MATIHKQLSKRVNGNNKAELLMRLTISREIRYRLKSGIFIPVNRFRDGIIIMPRGNAEQRAEFQELKHKIKALEDKLYGVFENNPRESLTKDLFVMTIRDFHQARSQIGLPLSDKETGSLIIKSKEGKPDTTS